jgi:hypothetical protein
MSSSRSGWASMNYQAFTNDSLTMMYEGSATAVIVLRHGAFPIALGNEMW